MDQQTENTLRKTLEGQLKRAHTQGLTQGAKAMCHTIRLKAVDDTKTPDERLADIIRFCDVSLGAKEVKESEV